MQGQVHNIDFIADTLKLTPGLLDLPFLDKVDFPVSLKHSEEFFMLGVIDRKDFSVVDVVQRKGLKDFIGNRRIRIGQLLVARTGRLFGD
jgi:hypothetical protein